MKKYTLYNKNKLIFYFSIFIGLDFLSLFFQSGGDEFILFLLIPSLMMIIAYIYLLCLSYFNYLLIDQNQIRKGLLFYRKINIIDIHEVIIKDDHIRLTDKYNKDIYIKKEQNEDFYDTIIHDIKHIVSEDKITYGSLSDKAEIRGFILFLFVSIIIIIFISFSSLSASLTNIFREENMFLLVLNIVQLVISLFSFPFSIILCIKYKRKRKNTIKYVKIFIWILCAYILLINVNVFYLVNEFDNVYLYIKSLLTTIQVLLIPFAINEYLKISIRVKETFIR